MVSQRVLNMAPSATGVVSDKIQELRAEGVEVYGFNIGEPDFPTPQPIVDACERALRDHKTKYVATGGILPLRAAIAEKLERENGLSYTAGQICVTTGAKQAVFNSIQAVCNPGDEVIIPTPCWVSYVEMIKLAGAVPVTVPTRKEDFQLDLEAVAAAVTDRTKLIIINSPNNPTGAVYTRETLTALTELAVAKNFYILADEIYEKLIYGTTEHVSIASLSPEAYEHTITVNGFSKSFCMTGWRIGYVAAPVEIAKGITALQSHQTSNSTTFVQWAALTALAECAEDVQIMKEKFLERRDLMYERLTAIPGVTCALPDGAFYLMPDISSFFGKSAAGYHIRNASDLCVYLLDTARVAVVTGEAFEAPNCIRFSYSTSNKMIIEGMAEVERALKRLK